MKHFLVIAAACAVALTTGCAGKRVNETEPQYKTGTPTVIPNVEFVNDGGLEDTIRVVDTFVDDERSPIVVQFNLVNDSNDEAGIRYRVLWFDAKSLEVRGLRSDAWSTLRLYGGERKPLQVTAPSPNAVDYRLVISEWDLDD